MRRFVFTGGRSSKFWEISVDGATYTVRYGRVGSEGQARTKHFATAQEAGRQAEKIIQSKVEKGYVESAGGRVDGASSAPATGNPSLEAAIDANPEDLEAWAVFADWLQSQGDPRGLLIAVQMVRETSPDEPELRRREQALMHEHSVQWLGRFAEDDWAGCTDFTWRNGFWQSAKVGSNWDYEEVRMVEMLPALVKHPSARFLQGLALGLPEVGGTVDYQGALDVLAGLGPLPSLKRLHVGSFVYPDETEISWVDVGDVSGVYGAVPNLETLIVRGGSIELGALRLPRLRELRLETGGLPKEPAQQLARGHFPALQHLEIWFGTEGYGGQCSEEEVRAVLANVGNFPGVRWLGLMNTDHSDAIPRMLLNTPWLSQITHLDLSMGTLTDEGAQVLLDHASQFRSLTINVADSYISESMGMALKSKLPKLILGRQDSEERYGVYVSVGE